MEKRVWIKSGVIEEIDQRQAALLARVFEKIVHYYRNLYQTRRCYDYPLSLSRLMKLCNRSGATVAMAIRYLANTIPYGSNAVPLIHYDRIPSQRNPSHRPYRIWLRPEVERQFLHVRHPQEHDEHKPQNGRTYNHHPPV